MTKKREGGTNYLVRSTSSETAEIIYHYYTLVKFVEFLLKVVNKTITFDNNIIILMVMKRM